MNGRLERVHRDILVKLRLKSRSCNDVTQRDADLVTSILNRRPLGYYSSEFDNASSPLPITPTLLAFGFSPDSWDLRVKFQSTAIKELRDYFYKHCWMDTKRKCLMSIKSNQKAKTSVHVGSVVIYYRPTKKSVVPFKSSVIADIVGCEAVMKNGDRAHCKNCIELDCYDYELSRMIDFINRGADRDGGRRG